MFHWLTSPASRLVQVDEGGWRDRGYRLIGLAGGRESGDNLCGFPVKLPDNCAVDYD